MGSKGSKASKQTSSSGPSPEQTQLANMQIGASGPVLNEFAAQLLNMLQTGGASPGQIPIAQRAVEASRAGNARAMRETNDQLSRSGIGGPFAEGIRAKSRQEGEFNTSQVLSQIVQQFLSQIGDFSLLRGSPAFGTGVSSSSGTGATSSGMGDLAALIQAGAYAWGR